MGLRFYEEEILYSTWIDIVGIIPLGGNRKGKFRTLFNLGIVFLLTGIWHGAAWNFVFWGIWHGLFIIIEKIINIKEFEKKYTQKWVHFLQHIYCILVFVTGWVMFRAETMEYAVKYIKNMFGLLKNHEIIYGINYYIDTFEIIIFIAAILCSVPLFRNLLLVKNKLGRVFVNVWLLILFVLSTALIASSTYNPFIYFRF